MEYKRYTLETYPTDFHGPFTVIYDNTRELYFTVNDKHWGNFNKDEPYEAFRFVGEAQEDIAAWYVRRWNKNNYDVSPLDQKRSYTLETFRQFGGSL